MLRIVSASPIKTRGGRYRKNGRFSLRGLSVPLQERGPGGTSKRWPAIHAIDWRDADKNGQKFVWDLATLPERRRLARSQIKWSLFALGFECSPIDADTKRESTPMARERYGVSAFPHSCEARGRTTWEGRLLLWGFSISPSKSEKLARNFYGN